MKQCDNPIVNRDGLKLNETCHNKMSHGFVKAVVLIEEANTRLCMDCFQVVIVNNVTPGTKYTTVFL